MLNLTLFFLYLKTGLSFHLLLVNAAHQMDKERLFLSCEHFYVWFIVCRSSTDHLGILAGKWRCRTGAAPHPAGPAGWSRWWDDGWGGPGTWAAGHILSAGKRDSVVFFATFFQPQWQDFNMLSPRQGPGCSGWESGRVQSVRSEKLPVSLQCSDPKRPQPQLSWPHPDQPGPYPGPGGHPRYDKLALSSAAVACCCALLVLFCEWCSRLMSVNVR